MRIHFFQDKITIGWITSTLSICVVIFLFIPFCSPSFEQSVWKTYRYDNARSGASFVKVSAPLSLRWAFHPLYGPKPAWHTPGEELARTHADNAFQVTIAHGLVYYGSSVDGRIYALRLENGEIAWAFDTDGPVRFAPTVNGNRVLAGSDDGYVYCLKAKTGSLVWKYRAGPSDEKVLGNGRLISYWPVRTSVLVDGDAAFFGAGVFPYEGIYVCALATKDGSLIWKNDTIGDRAHELDFGGISPQSYLVASEDYLYVPSGRAMPAAFDKKSGEFLHYYRPPGKVGGTWAMLDEGHIVAGVDHSGIPAKRSYDPETGAYSEDLYAWSPAIDLVATSEFIYGIDEKTLFAVNRKEYTAIREKVESIKENIRMTRARLDDLKRIRQEKKQAVGSELIEEESRVADRLNVLVEEERSLKLSVRHWTYPAEDLLTLIRTGDKIIAGGKGKLIVLDTGTGQALQEIKCEGTIYGLAATNDRLLVSREDGQISCYQSKNSDEAHTIEQTRKGIPYEEDEWTDYYRDAAEHILDKTGVRKGYCLVLGSATGRLAYELIKRSDLRIIGIENDSDKMNLIRNRMIEAGLYGHRIEIGSWQLNELPDYFANLIVSEDILTTGKISVASSELYRILRPYGGRILIGQPGERPRGVKSVDAAHLKTVFKPAESILPEVSQMDGDWIEIRRGALEGAAAWTEQYANPQNTSCSLDSLVKGPLGVLWWGEPGPERMMERHSKASSPVAMDGRMFIQGEEVVMAYDAYNGTLIWERSLPGAVRARADVDGGNLSLSKEGLFVAAHQTCYRLDPRTGQILHTYTIPEIDDGKNHRWGYVSYNQGMLFGTRAKALKHDYFTILDALTEAGRWTEDISIIPETLRGQYAQLKQSYPVPDERLMADFKRSGALWRFMTDFPAWEIYNHSKGAVTQNMMASDMIFALNPETGQGIWQYSGRCIAHITISRGDGKIFMAESDITAAQKREAIRNRQALIHKGIYKKSHVDADEADLDVRLVTCLDASTGKRLWENPVDLTECGGDAVATAYQDGVLLIFASMGSHDAWRHREGTLRWKRMTAIDAETGDVLWSHPNNYRTRPVIVGERIFLEPYVCNLHTGEILTRNHPVTHNPVPWEYLRPGHTCAVSSASANMLFYRSYCTAFLDFAQDRGLALFGGIRPGCWINLIPANGVLHFPEASSGCTCSFPIKTSVVFKQKTHRPQPFTVFITQGSMRPVKHFAINLGAPADYKDAQGTVWFGYPNPKTEYAGNHYPNYGVKFDLKESILPGMGYFAQDVRHVDMRDSDRPWLNASGCVGLTRCEIPLIDDGMGEKPGKYTVRLGFMTRSGDRKGQRVFDVSLQGQKVSSSLDAARELNGTGIRLVKEFRGIDVQNDLLLELKLRSEEPGIDNAPILNFIELIREDTFDS